MTQSVKSVRLVYCNSLAKLRSCEYIHNVFLQWQHLFVFRMILKPSSCSLLPPPAVASNSLKYGSATFLAFHCELPCPLPSQRPLTLHWPAAVTPVQWQTCKTWQFPFVFLKYYLSSPACRLIFLFFWFCNSAYQYFSLSFTFLFPCFLLFLTLPCCIADSGLAAGRPWNTLKTVSQLVSPTNRLSLTSIH